MEQAVRVAVRRSDRHDRQIIERSARGGQDGLERAEAEPHDGDGLQAGDRGQARS
jgi:hypothetical protein